MPCFSRALRWMPFAALVAAACLATSASAQEFRSDPSDEKLRLLGARAQGLYGSNRAQFDEYFQKYYFPAMTRSTPEGLAEVGKLRADLFKKFLWNTTNTDLQRDLTDMAFKAMGKVVISAGNPPYHPAVRYNAILVIGLLDQQYAVESGTPRPPVPLPQATKALTTIVDRGVSNDQFPPSVILGALIGLERHAKYSASLAPGAADAMTTALLKLVNQEKPIQEMDPAAYAWLRVKAASALANLGSVGPNNVIHDSILKLTGSLKSMDDRTAAAALLGQIKYDNVKLDAKASTTPLIKLASDLSADELKRAEEFEKRRMTGGGGFLSQRAEQIAMADPDGPTDAFPRRQVLTRMVELRAALNAVRKAVPEESQQQIDEILAAVKPVIEAAANEKTSSLRAVAAVRQMAASVAQVAGPAEPAPSADEGFTSEAPAADGEAAAASAAAASEAPAADGNETPPAEAPAAADEAEVPTAQPAAPTN